MEPKTLVGGRRRASVLPRCAVPSVANEASTLYRLMAWLSPSYPVGAFSYSSGLEWAIEAGDIVDAESLRRWITVVLERGAGFCDGVILAHAHRIAATPDTDNALLRALAELAAALAPSKERHL
jgi:urease accessory protein